ncbi:M15 family metallopeptidase [Emcibacter sp.]|uniref:M15 family metallopeptidase n=1 Tax=Emcibacter sp. TaxID=1979954 RepID=UPI002AA93008|nr:M15 family metallopeptidase [Emcibacter sp.]
MTFVGMGQASAGPESYPQETLVEAFADAVRFEQAAKKIPHLSAVLVRGGRVIWRGSISSGPDGQRETAGQEVFLLGTAGDLLAEVLFLQMVGQEERDLAASVAHYFPEIKDSNLNQLPVTLRLLPKHLAGDAVGKPIPPAVAPVLGSIHERVTGQSLEELVHERLFKCLGMSGSGRVTGQLPDRFVEGHYTSYENEDVVVSRKMAAEKASRTFYSSARDLGVLLQALASEDRNCHFPDAGDLPGPVSYSGSLAGHSVDIYLNAPAGNGVAVLANLHKTPVSQRLAKYAERLLAAAEEGKPLPRYLRTEEIAAKTLSRVAGYYQNGGNSLILRSLWGKLFLETASVTSEVRQKVGNWYLDDARNFSADVAIDPKGNWVRLGEVSYQRSEWKKPEPVSCVLAGLVGEYGSPEDYIRIYEWDGKPYARLDWVRYLPLKQLDETTLRVGEGRYYSGEKMSFERNETGRVIGIFFQGKTYERRDFGAEIEADIHAGIRVSDNLKKGALAARPPREERKFRASELVELSSLDPRLKLDIRYAGSNNFLGVPVYDEARAFLQRPGAMALKKAHDWLRERGYGLLIHDGYRPWFATKMFWDATPEESHIYVANPAHGSRHNRGSAIDLTLFELKTGKVVTMPGRYDEFWVRSTPKYIGGTDLERWHKDLLRQAMESNDFEIYPWEWWHFDHVEWKKYSIQNKKFSDISRN